MAAPLLLLSIDVEEDMPGWRIVQPTRVTNLAALPRLAEACARLGVRPTYLCNYPVVSDPEGAALLHSLAARGGCELGTHIHAWNTPPYGSVKGRAGDERTHTYYQYELEPADIRAKLDCVHAAVARVAGRPPVSFRAGRFGIDRVSLALLVDLGYEVDSSITPLVDHSQDGGPDFRRAPRFPYRPSATDPSVPGELPLVEIPVSIATTRRLPFAVQRAYVRIPPATRLRGFLSSDWLGLVDFAWLYPVRFDLDAMRRVADVLVAQKSPVLNVFLHSSELAPGVSGRVRTEEDVEQVFERLDALLAYCLERHGAVPATLAEAGERLAPGLGLRAGASVS
jgi:hypothetical protein